MIEHYRGRFPVEGGTGSRPFNAGPGRFLAEVVQDLAMPAMYRSFPL